MTTTEFANSGGCRLATYISGKSDADSPVVLLSNSLGSDHTMWAPQLALLEKHYRVIRYDTRGHGQSDAPQGDYSFEQLVTDSLSVLDHYQVAVCDYIGLSLGCMSGIGLALAHPQRLNRFIGCDGRADCTDAFRQSWDQRIAAIESNGLSAILEATMERWFVEKTRTEQKTLCADVAARFINTPVAGYRGCARAIQTLDYYSLLGDLRVPTLYIVGQHDSGAPPEEMQRMQAATPGSMLVEIPEAAHIANIDNPQKFNTAISNFLQLD